LKTDISINVKNLEN